MPRHCEGGLQIGMAWLICSGRVAQEGWEREQPVTIRLSSFPGNRLAGFRRDIGKIIRPARSCACSKVQAKPKLVEKSKFEPDQGCGKIFIAGCTKAGFGRVEQPRMGVALR